MYEITKTIKTVQSEFLEAAEAFQLAEKEAHLIMLTNQVKNPELWNDHVRAQEITKQHAKLETVLLPWLTIRTYILELLDLAALNDESLHLEMQTQLEKIQGDIQNLKEALRYNGPYDDHDALLRLHAGAGGVDAMDWTAMLERMYLRWAEKAGYKTELIEESSGDEAGIKSAVISVSGVNAYGELQSEHGVHRLVRLSPFNADNLRQTSFAMVEVLPQIDTPEEVAVADSDIRVDTFRASGHGGQSVNTTDSAVRITHIPTSVVVTIQNEKSQLQNKETALKIVRSKLAQMQIEQHTEKIDQLKGPNQEAAWGNQIRNYVLHPYTLVKDTRTKFEVKDARKVLDGSIDQFLH